MYFAQANQSLEQAKALTISTVSGRQLATEIWDALRAFRKQAEAQKEEVCRPLKTAWDEAKKPFDLFVKECQAHESALQAKMSAWDREQERIARVEQEKLQAKIDAKNAKLLAKAEEKGKDLSEVALKVAPVVQAPPKSMTTHAGTTQTRSVRKVYEPTNTATLMKDFPQLFDLNMALFNALAKTGILDNRPDVKITEEYVYSQRSK